MTKIEKIACEYYKSGSESYDNLMQVIRNVMDILKVEDYGLPYDKIVKVTNEIAKLPHGNDEIGSPEKDFLCSALLNYAMSYKKTKL